MRVLAGILAALILLIQYPLWLGKGGWLRAWEVDRRLAAQRENNEALEKRNRALGAEVRDLKQGFEAIEERARYELGFVKQDELFFQILEAPRPQAAPAAPADKGSPEKPQETKP
ncbi:MAG: cell division protein FtsB [Proteobacteria bacterium]|nr:cell division protein FtsB [Pseudomonadota bacterium]